MSPHRSASGDTNSVSDVQLWSFDDLSGTNARTLLRIWSIVSDPVHLNAAVDVCYALHKAAHPSLGKCRGLPLQVLDTARQNRHADLR